MKPHDGPRVAELFTPLTKAGRPPSLRERGTARGRAQASRTVRMAAEMPAS